MSNETSHTDAASIAVLTAPERSDYFYAVLGREIDLYPDPRKTEPLEDLLVNIALSGGRVAVLDESHFLKSATMRQGLVRYLDDPANEDRPLRIIAVCSDRKEGDEFLGFLAGYCGLRDIVWDASGLDIALEVRNLIDNPGTRTGVLPLLEAAERPASAVPAGNPLAEGFDLNIRIHVTPAGLQASVSPEAK